MSAKTNLLFFGGLSRQQSATHCWIYTGPTEKQNKGGILLRQRGVYGKTASLISEGKARVTPSCLESNAQPPSPPHSLGRQTHRSIHKRKHLMHVQLIKLQRMY